MSTDRETIRRWAKEHDAVPVRETAGDEDRYRIVRETDVGTTQTEAEWDEFFSHLDKQDHVVIYHEEEADEEVGGEPFDVAHQEEAISRSNLKGAEVEEQLLEGETVTSTITETTVVETVVEEEATIESELIESELVDQRVVDVDLIHRDCTTCDLVDEGEVDDRDWFDDDRYVELIQDEEGYEPTTDVVAVDEDYPFHADLQVEETWEVTREFVERFTVESSIADVDVEESDTIEERDIDVEGLQRDIVEADLLEMDTSADDILAQCDVETVFEDNAVYTYFDREVVVQDEIVDRRRLRADVTEGELEGMELIRSENVATELGGDEALGEVDEEEVALTSEGDEMEVTEVDFDSDQIGKTVIDATGDEVGMVTDVEEDREILHVDVHPGITEKIKAALDWGGVSEDDYPVTTEQVAAVTDDEIQLKEREELVTEEHED